MIRHIFYRRPLRQTVSSPTGFSVGDFLYLNNSASYGIVYPEKPDSISLKMRDFRRNSRRASFRNFRGPVLSEGNLRNEAQELPLVIPGSGYRFLQHIQGQITRDLALCDGALYIWHQVGQLDEVEQVMWIAVLVPGQFGQCFRPAILECLIPPVRILER